MNTTYKLALPNGTEWFAIDRNPEEARLKMLKEAHKHLTAGKSVRVTAPDGSNWIYSKGDADRVADAIQLATVPAGWADGQQ